MKKVYKFQSLLLLLALLLVNMSLMADEHKKTFSESYNVKADATVNITNEYGNVLVETWDKSMVQIDVEVSVVSKSESKAKQILDKVTVDMSGSANEVKARTNIKGSLNCKNCSFTINYKVRMPASNALQVDNSFGNVYVPAIDGKTDLNMEYGSMEIEKLTNKENSISMKFGDLEIGDLKSADVDMEYGSLEIGNAGYLDLYLRFVSSEIDQVSELLLDAEYEGSEIGNVGRLHGNLDFHGLEIDELMEKADLVSTYGGIEILRISKGFSLVDISNEFGSIDLGVSSSASYSLQAEASFGDIHFPESKAQVTKRSERSFESAVEAFIGSDKSSSSKVVLKVSNSSISVH